MSKLEYLMMYGFARGVGHTRTALDGVLNVADAVLIVHDYDFGKNLGLPRHKFIVVQALPEALIGMSKPIVIDLHALEVLFREHQAEMLERNS